MYRGSTIVLFLLLIGDDVMYMETHSQDDMKGAHHCVWI